VAPAGAAEAVAARGACARRRAGAGLVEFEPTDQTPLWPAWQRKRTTMPSEVFWTATMLAGPRRRTEPHCSQYTENIGLLRVRASLARLDGGAGSIGWQFTQTLLNQGSRAGL
jgi:hypothetical protein